MPISLTITTKTSNNFNTYDLTVESEDFVKDIPLPHPQLPAPGIGNPVTYPYNISGIAPGQDNNHELLMKHQTGHTGASGTTIPKQAIIANVETFAIFDTWFGVKKYNVYEILLIYYFLYVILLTKSIDIPNVMSVAKFVDPTPVPKDASNIFNNALKEMFLTEQKWKEGITIKDNEEQSKTTITISDELKQDLFSEMRDNATTLTTDKGMRQLLQKYTPNRLAKRRKTTHLGGGYKRKTRKTRKTRKPRKTRKTRKTRKSKKTKKSRKTRKSRK